MKESLVNTEKAFGELSKSYDEAERSNEILQWMRGIVQDVCTECFKEGDEVLEINAGTGEDALFLAGKGIRVYATDISEKMIRVLNSKVKKAEAGAMIRSDVLSFEDIRKISKENFSGALSSFGGLNCINDFSKLSDDLAGRIKRGGKFVAVVMNKICPWEIFYYLLKLDFKNAFRRFRKGGIHADINGWPVKTHYFAPGRFGKFFGKNFRTERIISLAFLTPPPYLSGIYKKFKRTTRLLMKIDSLIKGVFPFNRLGDHFIIQMRPDRSINLTGL